MPQAISQPFRHARCTSTTSTETYTLTLNEIPKHTHLVNVATNTANTNDPSLGYFAIPNINTRIAGLYGAASNANLNPQAIGSQGGNLPHTNMQPYLCMNFII